MDKPIISQEEVTQLIARFLSRRGSATEDEIRYYLDLETNIRLEKAQQSLLEQGKITVEWDDRGQDYILALRQ